VGEHLRVNDVALGGAGEKLVAAACVLTEGGRRRVPHQLPSLTGLGGEVRLYLKGLQMAEEALAEAAKTASLAVAGMMQDSKVLDYRIGNLAENGFVGRGSKR
jgi:hypothetical protein